MTQDGSSEPGGLVPGEQLAGYQIQEQIGRGGMAVVYRALDVRLGRLVALKVLAQHLTEDEAFRQRFIRESRALAGLDHPHIIPVYDAGEAGGMFFIAMRYVANGDVRSLIDAEGALSTARVAAITSQVASALDAAHSYGLVHRDVKPGNVLLAQASDGSDHVYLSDFGLSKHSLNAATLTATGQFLGTLDYVSPEQIQGQPVDGRADQYALACTVVEMLTGAPPYRRDDSMALMWAKLESAPPSITDRRSDLPAAVDQVIAIAMAKSPAGRFPTCHEFAMALDAACELATPPRRTPAPTQAAAIPAQPAPQTRADAQVADSGRPPRKTDVVQQASHHVGHRPLSQRPPTERPRYAGVLPGGRERILPETWQAQPDRATPARRPPRRPNRNALLAAAIVVVGIAGVAGIGFKLLYHPAAAATPPASTSTGTSSTSTLGADATVRAYFAAINAHNYQRAWQLVGNRGSFSSFEAGFSGTAHDRVTIVQTNGDVVLASLDATQADGSIKKYQGTYTVMNGIITNSNVTQTN